MNDRLPLAAKHMPPILKEIIEQAPASRRLASFIAALAPLSALATRVRIKYPYDTRESALLLQVIIEGEQAIGKAYAAEIERLLMGPTLRATEKKQRRQEQEYRERKNTRRYNEKLEEQPRTFIRIIPPTISKTVLVRRADFFERYLGDTLTFWMFAEELAQVTDAGKQGYSNLRTIMRTAFDLGSLFGMDFASDNSYSAIADINICSMFCTTPSALDRYMDDVSVEGGNVSRCILYRFDDELAAKGTIFKAYTPEQREHIHRCLEKLMDDTFTPDGKLQPTCMLNTRWLEPTINKWLDQQRCIVLETGSKARDVFRKRACVNAFRVTALCYYLYGLGTRDQGRGTSPTANGQQPTAKSQQPTANSQRHCKRIFLFMADYILKALLDRWGNQFEDLNRKRNQNHGYHLETSSLFSKLPNEFTREQLTTLMQELKITTAPRQYIYLWRVRGLIDATHKNLFHKINKHENNI